MSGKNGKPYSDPIAERLKAAQRAHNQQPTQDEQGQPFPYKELHIHIHDLTLVLPPNSFNIEAPTTQVAIETPPAVLGPQGDKEVKFLRDSEGRLQAAIVKQDEPKND
jgi:hypothetical protein